MVESGIEQLLFFVFGGFVGVFATLVSLLFLKKINLRTGLKLILSDFSILGFVMQSIGIWYETTSKAGGTLWVTIGTGLIMLAGLFAVFLYYKLPPIKRKSRI